MNEYHFLDENTELTKSDLIRKYNSLIEDIWLLQHTVRELDDNYELMLNTYEGVADKLYGQHPGECQLPRAFPYI